MRRHWLLALVASLLAAPAAAQGGLAEMMCQTKPTVDCALEIAVEATRVAETSTKENLPWGRLIETASRAGRIDVAVQLAEKLKATDSIATADLIVALTRAGRLPEVGAILARQGKTPSEFAYAIAPVLVERQQYAELETFTKTVQPPPDAFQVELRQIIGDLLANRAEAALQRLAKLPERERSDMAGLAAETLYYSGNFEQARPIVPSIPADRPILVCQFAEALRDRAYAATCADALKTVSKEDATHLRRSVATALAAAGEWQKAIEIADAVEGPQKAFAYVNVAIYSREPQVLQVIDRKMKEDPANFEQDRVNNLLVRALVLCGYEAVAQSIVNAAASDLEREELSTVLAAALAQAGKPQDALRIALSLTDQYRKSWALWEVASKMKR